MNEFIMCRGVKFPYDKRFISDKVAKRLRTDTYESPEVLGLAKFLKPTDRILEFGSGLGFISSFAAKQFGVSDITCVEANPELCSYIRRVHSENGIEGATVCNAVALSDASEWPAGDTVPFYITNPFWSSSLAKPRKQVEYLETSVPVIRFNELIEQKKPTVIICDIEGGEEDLFRQAKLKGVRSVFMELHTRIYGGHGIRNVFDAMHRNGFFYHQKASCADVVLFERLKNTP